MDIVSLNEEFGIEGALRFEAAEGGLISARISSPLAEATVYLHGAHVTHWQPKGEQPVLFLSPKSKFAAGGAIRGGIPICFPWFGPRDDGQAGPMHGFARTQEWKVGSAAMDADGTVHLLLQLGPTEVSRSLGFDRFAVAYRVTIGTELSAELLAANLGADPMPVSEALHTYLAVGSVREIAISGLDGVAYLDKRDENALKVQEGDLPIQRDVDRVYLSTEGSCIVSDPVWKRRLVVEKSGSKSTVVWNPGPEIAKGMADLGEDNWPGFICVEAANALENALTLAPGEAHTLRTTIRVEQ